MKVEKLDIFVEVSSELDGESLDFKPLKGPCANPNVSNEKVVTNFV